MSKSLMGVVLPPNNSFSRTHVFINAFKGARGPTAYSDPFAVVTPRGSLGPNGYPPGDFAICIYKADIGNPNTNGTYKFSCTGHVTGITYAGACTAVTNNLTYNGTTNTTTADVVKTAGTDLYLKIATTGGAISNAKLLRPGYTSDAAIFTNEFQSLIRPFGPIRSMQAGSSAELDPVTHMGLAGTPYNFVTTWASRPLPEELTYTVLGWPYEILIALSNTNDADLWVNVPDQADDDHIDQLAKLVSEQLKPTLRVYTEYSNEVWNFSLGPQATRNRTAALADTDITALETDQYYAAFTRMGKKALQIGDAFRKWMPADRVRALVGTQLLNFIVAKKALAYIQVRRGDPAKYIYGAIGAPYFGLIDSNNFLSRTDLTVDSFFTPYSYVAKSTGLTVSGNNFMEDQAGLAILQMQKFANFYKTNYPGIVPILYEGSTEIDHTTSSIDAKIAVMSDPRLLPAMLKYLRGWFAIPGVGAFTYFHLIGQYDRTKRFSTYGLTDNILNLTGPKYTAAKTVAGESAAPADLPDPFALDGVPMGDNADIVLKRGATYTFAKTKVITAANVHIHAEEGTGPLPVIKYSCSDGSAAITLSRTSDGFKIEDVSFNLGPSCFAFDGNAENLNYVSSITRCEVNKTGGGLFRGSGTEDVVIDSCKCDGAVNVAFITLDSNFVGSSELVNRNITIKNCRALGSASDVVVSVHQTFGLVIEDCYFYGPMSSSESAIPLRIYDGGDVTVKRTRVVGPCVFGPDNQVSPNTEAEKDKLNKLRLTNITVQNCSLGDNVFLEPGLVNASIKETCVFATGGTYCFEPIVNVLSRPKPVVAILDVDGVKVGGGGAMIAPVDTTGITFTGCFFNGVVYP